LKVNWRQNLKYPRPKTKMKNVLELGGAFKT
jgi:hypothetical protein